MQHGQAAAGRARAAALLLVLSPMASATAEAPVLRLEDGRDVLLAGVEAALRGQADPEPVRLSEPAAATLDRHGRVRGQVQTADGRWLQGWLVERGLAVVAPARDVPEAVVAELLRRERAARAEGRGGWAEGGAWPWPAERVRTAPGRYVVVRGRVLAVARRQQFVYLNFGEDWRTDFTARATLRDAARFKRAGVALDQLAGRDVLVRGHLFDAFGPMVELTHPAEIDVAR